jgi:hypothetical protein
MMDQMELPLEPHSESAQVRHPSVAVREYNSETQTPSMLYLAAQFAAECDPDEEFSSIRTRATMESYLSIKDRKFSQCLIAYVADDAVGFLLASLAPSLYSRSMSARQDLWFVLPRYRGGYATLRLLGEFERWAINGGATRLVTGSTNVSNIRLAEKTSSALSKLGYERIGSVHVKEVGNG